MKGLKEKEKICILGWESHFAQYVLALKQQKRKGVLLSPIDLQRRDLCFFNFDIGKENKTAEDNDFPLTPLEKQEDCF